MVVACLALIVALGGVSYATAVLPASSVGAKQLRKGSVTPSKLRKGVVTPSKVDPRTIALFKGQKGDPGPQGPKGEPGTVDSSGLVARFGKARTWSAFHFAPGRSSIDYSNAGPGRTTTTGMASFNAPLDLPQGARVTRVTGYFVDNNPTQDLTFFLVRNNPSAGDAEVLGQVSTDGSSSAVRSVSFEPSGVVIDNETRAFSISGQFPGYDPSNLVFHGMRVEYAL